MQIERLKQSYQSNIAVKTICDHMADRSKNQNETSLHRILYYFEQDGTDFKRSEVIAAFRLLEDAECGKYVEGRHGWKSRFVWSVKSKLVSGAALGTETRTALVADDAPNEQTADDEMIEHTYVLRADLAISIELPADLSRNEAQRLSQFIDSLSFEE